MSYKNLISFVVLVALSFSSAASLAFDHKFSPKNKTKAETYDPFEEVNRVVYGFNEVMDDILIKPVAKAYRFVIPEFGRKSIRNFLGNLAEPVNLLNSAFQLKGERAAVSFWRFTINTTWGLGGLFDPAKSAGLPAIEEDFGQTLGYYKVGQGPYIVWPFMGPSTARDSVGRVADYFSNPFNYQFNDYGDVTITALGAIDGREKLLDVTEEVERTALDPYATIRSLYLQRRLDSVLDGGR